MDNVLDVFVILTKGHSLLFVILLLANILDWLSGWAKARIKKIENSQVGYLGVLKKISIWIIVLIAFFVTNALEELGALIQIDLSIAKMMGWFTLISLIFNEIRSILENLVECDIKIPIILVKGLKSFQERIDNIID